MKINEKNLTEKLKQYSTRLEQLAKLSAELKDGLTAYCLELISGTDATSDNASIDKLKNYGALLKDMKHEVRILNNLVKRHK